MYDFRSDWAALRKRLLAHAPKLGASYPHEVSRRAVTAELAAILATVVTVGAGLAGLTVAFWRDLRAEDAELRADIRAVRAAIDAERVAHEGMHAAERQARADEKRELLAAIAAIGDGAP